MVWMSWIDEVEKRKGLLIGGILLISISTLLHAVIRNPIAYDSFWHLQMGKDWVENGLSPWIDHYSFTFQGHPIKNPPIAFQVLLHFAVNELGVRAGFILVKVAVYFLILGAATFWGISATVARYLITRQFDTLLLVQMRITLSCVLLLPFFLIYRPELLRVKRADLFDFALLGIVGAAGSNFTYYFAIQETNVATAILMQYLAPVLVLWLYTTFGTWRPAFLITGSLGLLWMLAWWRFYPKQGGPYRQDESLEQRAPMLSLLNMRNTWGLILGRSLTDPVWFFITDWFAVYLVAKGFRLEDTIAGFWVPFLAADFGNFAGGGFSSWLITRGWPVARARKFVVVAGGIGMAMLAATVGLNSFAAIVALFAVATFCYAALSTMMLALAADLYPSGSVASVSGMSGTGAGIGTIISTFLIGAVSDRYSFEPVLLAASAVPLIAVVLVLCLVRETPRNPAAA